MKTAYSVALDSLDAYLEGVELPSALELKQIYYACENVILSNQLEGEPEGEPQTKNLSKNRPHT